MVKKKYNYNSLESQKLFEEFTLLLAEIARYFEETEGKVVHLEDEIRELEEKLVKAQRIRYMIRTIIEKLFNTVCRVLLYLPKRLWNKFRSAG